MLRDGISKLLEAIVGVQLRHCIQEQAANPALDVVLACAGVLPGKLFEGGAQKYRIRSARGRTCRAVISLICACETCSL